MPRKINLCCLGFYREIYCLKIHTKSFKGKIKGFEPNECLKKFDRIPDLKIDIQTVHEGPQDFYAKNAQRSLSIVISNET